MIKPQSLEEFRESLKPVQPESPQDPIGPYFLSNMSFRVDDILDRYSVDVTFRLPSGVKPSQDFMKLHKRPVFLFAKDC